MAMFMCGGVLVFSIATRKGWIRGVFVDGKRREVLKERRQKLAQDRQRAIDDARNAK
jgi:hypothetical protein